MLLLLFCFLLVLNPEGGPELALGTFAFGEDFNS